MQKVFRLKRKTKSSSITIFCAKESWRGPCPVCPRRSGWKPCNGTTTSKWRLKGKAAERLYPDRSCIGKTSTSSASSFQMGWPLSGIDFVKIRETLHLSSTLSRNRCTMNLEWNCQISKTFCNDGHFFKWLSLGSTGNAFAYFQNISMISTKVLQIVPS